MSICELVLRIIIIFCPVQTLDHWPGPGPDSGCQGDHGERRNGAMEREEEHLTCTHSK